MNHERRRVVNLLGPPLEVPGGISEFCRGLVSVSCDGESPICFRYVDVYAVKGRRQTPTTSRLTLRSVLEGARLLGRAPTVLRRSKRCSRVFYLNASSYWGFWEKALLVGLLRGLRCRVILHIHSDSFQTFVSDTYCKLLVACVLRVCHLVILASSEDWGYINKRLGVKESRLAWHPLPTLGPGRPSQADKEGHGDVYRIAKEYERVCISISVLEDRKRISGLVEAMSIIRNEHGIDACLIVAGYGEREEEVRRACEAADGCFFVGQAGRGMKACLFEVADAYVSMSSAESHGVSLVEALSAGIKVVSTPVGVFSDPRTYGPSEGVHLTGNRAPTVGEFAATARLALQESATREAACQLAGREAVRDYTRFLADRIAVLG